MGGSGREGEKQDKCEQHCQGGIKRIGSRLGFRGKKELVGFTEVLSLCDGRIDNNFDRSDNVRRGSNWGQERGRVGVSSISVMPQMGLIIPRGIVREPTVPAIQ